jgi:outer membrane protein OmpA-like peptidoglycan-associated protein
LIGQTKEGNQIRKESTLRLVRNEAPIQEGLRFSILFDFDKSKTVAAYEKFLTEVVAPLVPDYGTVIIHGHTDIIGESEYNMTLSQERAHDAQNILEKALMNAGKKGVKFEVYGFGADEKSAPFENKLPEERFYNRTVIIDIVPNN